MKPSEPEDASKRLLEKLHVDSSSSRRTEHSLTSMLVERWRNRKLCCLTWSTFAQFMSEQRRSLRCFFLDLNEQVCSSSWNNLKISLHPLFKTQTQKSHQKLMIFLSPLEQLFLLSFLYFCFCFWSENDSVIKKTSPPFTTSPEKHSFSRSLILM